MKWDSNTANGLARQAFFGVPIYESKNIPHWWDIYVGVQQPYPRGPIQQCIIVGEMGNLKHILALQEAFAGMRKDMIATLDAWERSLFGDSQVGAAR